MDFSSIDQFMKQTGLATEPAFDYLHFLIEPIPSPETKRILGLYFPEGEKEKQGFGYLPPSTIILPPDASEGTLLHELGHRYGHYYHDDLSEPFAEKYRMEQEKRLSSIYAGSYARQGTNTRREVSMNHLLSQSLPAIALASDWSVDGFAFRSPPSLLKAGVAIAISVNGFVNDLRDSFPDFWQVAVFVAYSSADGNSIAGSDAQVFQSGIDGMPFPYATRIDCSNSYLFPYRLGPMPNRSIWVFAEVYANHDSSPVFTPGTFAQRSSNGWQYLSSIVTQILLDTAPPPPPGGGMQLYQQARTAAAETYRGKAETAVFTFSTGPEQLDFINNFFVNQLVEECQSAIQQNSPGDQLLTLQLYRDISSILRTDYKLYLTATDISGNQLPWPLIIVGALALIAYWLIIRPVLNQLIGLIWGPTDGGERPPLLSNPLVIAAGLGAVLVGIALVKGTSVKSAVTGKE